jgi:hypothetical protein
MLKEMIVKIRVPQIAGNKVGLTEILKFLEDPIDIGMVSFSWECPISKQILRIEFNRRERAPASYYREPYPVTMSLSCPKVYYFPENEIPLSQPDISELISDIKSELAKKWN